MFEGFSVMSLSEPVLPTMEMTPVAGSSVMPVVAPLGRGTYSRPAIYAVYTLSLLNGDAQYTLWNPGDIRAGHTDVHYLGLGAEWWFNSSSYP